MYMPTKHERRKRTRWDAADEMCPVRRMQPCMNQWRLPRHTSHNSHHSQSLRLKHHITMLYQRFDTDYYHMGTAIKHPVVPDRVKPSFVIFDIRALWRSALRISARMSKIGLARTLCYHEFALKILLLILSANSLLGSWITMKHFMSHNTTLGVICNHSSKFIIEGQT